MIVYFTVRNSGQVRALQTSPALLQKVEWFSLVTTDIERRPLFKLCSFGGPDTERSPGPPEPFEATVHAKSLILILQIF